MIISNYSDYIKTSVNSVKIKGRDLIWDYIIIIIILYARLSRRKRP